MKRILAMLLAVAMLVGLLPSALAIDAQTEPTATTLTAEEISDDSRLAELTEQRESDRPRVDTYDPDDIVTAIVVLEDAPVLEEYDSAAALVDDVSAGKAVADFLASDAAVAQSQALLQTQDALNAEIQRVAGIGNGFQVVSQWTTAINAVAVKVPYGKLDEIRALDGVKQAYVERTFARPDEPTTDAGDIASYSYDMVGIQQTWDAGYTGKGMLIAVLDTGLDLNWQSAADPHIVSVHEAFTDNSFRSADAKEYLRYNATNLAAFLKSNTLNAEFRGGTTELTYDGNALYKNLKVPFAYDYADLDLNVMPSESDHGTHVAGTVAGYVKTEEGAVKFSGTAPDAQLMIMKVFPDAGGGAQESDTVDALEDALKLGADVINLSLGSDNGYAHDDTAQQELYDRVQKAGIILMTSAGNSDASSANNHYGGQNLTSDPETSMMSAPAVYASNMAIASINNTIECNSVLTWTDQDGKEHRVVYLDPNGISMKYKFAAGEPVSIIPVGGTGSYDDYYNAGFRSYYGYGEDKGVSGIALVQRGEISFADKINNAGQFYWSYYDSAAGTYINASPVQAVLVYDNVDGDLISMDTTGTSLTSAFISKADGEAIIEAINSGCDVKISVLEDDEIDTWKDGGQMSEFTSWGAGPGLELKPEITAPGGNIWSTIPGGSSADGSTGSYGMMSGTSMAAPHMTGIAALVEQYVQTLGLTNKSADADLTSRLLVSTALPQRDENGVYYSPRRQGAGLVNTAAAIKTPAYITVDGQTVGKLELKDDPERTGTYELNFNVNNLSETEQTYQVKAVVMRPDTETVTSEWGERSVMKNSDVLVKEVELGTVTVPARSGGADGSAAVSQSISLTAEEKKELDTLFKNGAYIEGFVVLTNTDAEQPQLGLPFLAFYGDWTAAPIFDAATWLDNDDDAASYLDGECTWWTTILGYYDGYNYYNLGQNIFDSTAADNQRVYRQENVTISPDGFFRSINDYEVFQLRQSKVMVVEVKDKQTGEVYYRDYATYQFKTTYDAEYAMGIPSSLYYFTHTDWNGTDMEGNVLPSGTQCVYSITAYGDGEYPTVYNNEVGRTVTDVESIIPGENEPTFNGHAMDMTGDVVRFDVMVDTEAPKLVNNAVTIYEQDGHTYLEGTVTDEGSIASLEVVPRVTRTQKSDPTRTETKAVLADAFYADYIYDADIDRYTFKADVTEYVHNESYPGENDMFDFDWTGDVYIYTGDYGGNLRTYGVTVEGNTNDGIILSQSSALLHVGSEFDLSVIDNTGSDSPILRTSSNPAVATIDELGTVKALSAGQTTITVSNAVDSAVCVVAVEEYPTEVLDFDLEITQFSGLKPNGTAIVKVANLKPADVELSQIAWEVTEDDPELYSGLITCSRYTTDGLSASVFLNYSAYDPYETGAPAVPGQGGTLKVTLNGVSREMHIDWEDLYKTSTDEDLVSDMMDGDQTCYVTQGETAALVARYNNVNAHDFGKVELYTADGYVMSGSDNPTTPAVGLSLDGPTFYHCNGEWKGKLVNQEGYALPEKIHVLFRYDYGYEYELTQDAYYNGYTYDPTTGEISTGTPYGSETTLVIRADGVESEGNPAGEMSGTEYETPEALYGPFDWTVTSGSGELTTAEGVQMNGATKNVAYYTPAEPGVSYLTATSKDGAYSINFAVISEPVRATKLDLDRHEVTMKLEDTAMLTPIFDQEPTLESDKELIWTSFDPDVVTVDENGKLTAVGAGYAYVKAAIATNTTVQTYCIVHVEGCEHSQTEIRDAKEPTCTEEGYTGDTFCTVCGELVEKGEVIPAAGHQFVDTVVEPDCEHGGYTEHVCSVCGHTERDTEVPATGHQFVDTVVEPDCEHGGYTEHVCSVCGHTERDSEVPATGHSFGEWETKKEATCFEAGEQIRTCTVCGATETRTIEPNSDHCPSAAFEDLDCTRWYHEGVDFVLENGYMVGATATHFDPNSPVTRGQLVTILYRVAGAPEVNGDSDFTDVAQTSYYHDAVVWAKQNGIAAGITPTAFCPGNKLTREQMASFLYRYADKMGYDVTKRADLDIFTDADQISAYATNAISWAVAEGLLVGTDNAMLPGGNATRAQAASVIARFCKNIVK